MTSHTIDHKTAPTFGPAQWVQVLLVYLFIPALLWLCAGQIAWWQSWVYALLIVAAGLLGRWGAERRHPGLMAERIQFGSAPGVKSWDKLLSPLMSVSVSFPLIIVAGLDRRFGWSPAFASWLTVAGLLLIAVGYAFGTWAVMENRFFSSVVRIQLDRGHVVCDTGPYRIVRHPGYAGNVLALPGVALALGSLWTFIPAACAVLIAVIRTALEDRTLQAELPGYREYAQRVRYRLLPYVW